MKWTLENFPLEMNNMEPRVREKAIEIANQLKKEGKVKELSIVAEAIKQTEKWFSKIEA